MLSARLGVKDLDREIKFYESLGFTIDRTGSGARVSMGEAAFTLAVYDELRVSDGPLLDWDRKPGQFGVGIQLYVFVQNVDKFVAGIPIGVSRAWPVQDKAWGLRELTLKTPSGYLVTFAQRLR